MQISSQLRSLVYYMARLCSLLDFLCGSHSYKFFYPLWIIQRTGLLQDRFNFWFCYLFFDCHFHLITNNQNVSVSTISDQSSSKAARSISWAMLINILGTPLLLGKVFRTLVIHSYYYYSAWHGHKSALVMKK